METTVHQKRTINQKRMRTPPLHSSTYPNYGSAQANGHTRNEGVRGLLIDLEEDEAARAVVFGLLAEMVRN